MSKNNQFLRSVHTFVSYDEQLKLRKANVIQDTDLVSLLDRGDVVSPDVLNVRGFKNPKNRQSTK